MTTVDETPRGKTEPDTRSKEKADQQARQKTRSMDKPGPASEAELDEALDETFPASDPISPSRIDGPNN